MGWLARITSPPASGNLLGMAGGESIPREMRAERDREIARRVLRGQVVGAEVRVIGQVSTFAAHTAANIKTFGEQAAALVPHEREAVDVITNTGVVLVQQAMQKLADP